MAIRWDKLTVKAQEAVQRANDLASEHGNPELQPVHILAALLEDHEGIVAPLLERVGLQVPAVQAEAMAQIERLPKVSGGGAAPASLSPAANQLLENAFKEASNFKDEFVSTEHLNPIGGSSDFPKCRVEAPPRRRCRPLPTSCWRTPSKRPQHSKTSSFRPTD